MAAASRSVRASWRSVASFCSRAREDDARRRDVDLIADVDDDRVEPVGSTGLDQDLVEVGLEVVGLETEGQGRVGLGVHVDDEDAVAVRGECAGEIHGRGRLSTAALLIDDRDHAHNVPPPRRSSTKSSGDSRIAPGFAGILDGRSGLRSPSSFWISALDSLRFVQPA